MDTNIAVLKDNKRQIESLLRRIQLNKDKYNSAELSEKLKIKDNFKMDFRSIKEIMSAMEMEIGSLKSEDAEVEYKAVLGAFKSKTKTLHEEIEALDRQQQQIQMKEIIIEDSQFNGLKVQEAFDKGDKIIEEGDRAIERMTKKIAESKDVAGITKQALIKQRQQLMDTQKNLKEMDYSLERTQKVLKKMAKRYATDKCIMVMIVLIALSIIAIIIVGAVGGDKDRKFNVPHDIFLSSKKKVETPATTASTTTTTPVNMS